MDKMTFIALISVLYVCIHILVFSLSSKNTKYPKLAPGPPSYPIIGNILQLGPAKLHQALDKLSKTYGPIMTVKIGTITTVVISSPSIAKEALHKNDQALASRFIPESVQALSHDHSSVVFLPVSTKWRTLRKVCATKIFSSQQLDSTQALRQKKMKDLLDYLHENCQKGLPIDIGETAFTTVLNSISNTLFSVDLASYSSGISQKFRNVISSVLAEASKPNIADYYPIFRRLDPQGARQRMQNYYRTLLDVFDCIVEERTQRVDSIDGDDVLDSFLDITRRENSELTRHDVLHLFLDLFVAGLDTTSATIEWVMAELLHNPEKLSKTKKELDQVLGESGLEAKDSNIWKLTYLQAVVKETLRLHPTAPILIHKSVGEVDICGFHVPKDAQVLVNVWSMGRDSKTWKDPNAFVPERFLENEKDFRGDDYGFIPFGSGRRMCPGVPLANRIVHTILASLLYHFDWKLADGEQSPDMDMTEKFTITLHKLATEKLFHSHPFYNAHNFIDEEGWPLGLRLLNARIGLQRNGDFSGSVSFSTMLTASPTLSTDSSSDVDSQSTGTFFRDKSITLGSLIGISSFLEVSRRSSRGRMVQPSKNNEKNHKLRHWLFSLCSKLTTDAVSVNSAAPSLGNNLVSERRAANQRKNNQCSNIHGPNHLSPVQEPNSLFHGSSTTFGDGRAPDKALEQSNGYGTPIILCCLCR
ncbi:unnamed protein product [Sphenostylis stenocarpa]|uniref:Cytochrome P450 n=1 Tax=Sphenostylis stenocarpa TaxID=92480 RepID=A0AA86SSI8_9FABA|nr:unnamed protein product [Sphenostylis stenocarpa]